MLHDFYFTKVRVFRDFLGRYAQKTLSLSFVFLSQRCSNRSTRDPIDTKLIICNTSNL